MVFWDMVRAKPKSHSLTTPPAHSSTFWGFKSRCTMLLLHARTLDQ